MKILIYGALLLCSFNLSAQNFVDSQEARTVIEDMTETTTTDLDSTSDVDIYTQKKNNLKAYQVFENHLNGGLDVEESLMMAVLEVMPLNITVEQFNNDDLEPELMRIKTHLTSILTQ